MPRKRRHNGKSINSACCCLSCMRFSNTELQHLVRAWFAISLAFAILLSDAKFSLSGKFILELLPSFLIAAITVGLGFLLHELAHKFLAQRYGAIAEFRASDTMLIAAVVMSFFGFLFAAPGAVLIHGNINAARNGRISAAGPIVNVVLAVAFFVLLTLFSEFGADGILISLASYGMYINGWLAVFNMLPFWQLDGLKVWRWNKQAYAGLMAAAVFAMFFLPRLALRFV